MIYQVLSPSGEVLNTVVADATFMAAQYPGGHYRPVSEPAAANESGPRHVSVGAFFDRFGAAKYAILADTNPTVQALVKDSSVRKFIDLDRPDLPVALDLLVQAGHEIDADAILNAPVQPGERP